MQFINILDYVNRIIQVKLLYLVLSALGAVLFSCLTTALICNQIHSATKPIIKTVIVHEKCVPKCIKIPPQKKTVFKKNQLVPVTNGRQF